MAEQMVTKVTLSSKKVVLLRDMKIRHTELAAQAAAPRSNGDPNVLGLLLQKELLKLLVCKIGDSIPSAADLEDMDELFTLAEYNELLRVLQELNGGVVGKPLATEVVAFGSK